MLYFSVLNDSLVGQLTKLTEVPCYKTSEYIYLQLTGVQSNPGLPEAANAVQALVKTSRTPMS